MRFPIFRSVLPAATAGLLALGAPAATQTTPRVGADVALTRTAADTWRLDYTFDAPVAGIALGPSVAAYRQQAWRVVTPGVELVARDGGEALVASDSARSRIRVEVRRYTEYAPDGYAPLVPFTDGGAALYLGYFAGSVIRDGKEEPADFRFRFAGLPSERVLPPGGPGAGTYVYFGPQEPVALDHARLVVDPGAPAWLRDALLRVAGASTRVFTDRLGSGLPSAPLVLVGAGEMDRQEGFSVKGGAVGGQFVMLLRGRGLREETERARAGLERLTAHELAHLWQLHTLPAAFNDEEPWLHEGAAEAMAVYALGASGLWSQAQVEEFAGQTAERCRTALAGATLPEAKRQGNWDAVYACGFGLYWSAGADPLPVWARLAEAVRRDGQVYTQATLDRVLAAPANGGTAP
jgi:hypothetical protein